MKSIPFRIFKIENDPIELHADLVNHDLKDVEFGFQVSFNGDIDARIIGCRTNYLFRQKETIISSLTVYCYFMIDPAFVESGLKNNVLIFPKEFLRYIATISVGTARGIQHAKTQGTILNSLVIPPVNLMEIDIKDFRLKVVEK